jgi:perosamine synthetase
MSNLLAAIGAAQLERIEEFIEGKRAIARFYDERLAEVDRLQLPVEKPWARNVYWMYHLLLRDAGPDTRRVLQARMAERGVETREGFLPYNMQEIYIEQGLVRRDECPRANAVANAGFYLPSGPFLPQEDLEYVAETLKDCLRDLP